MRVLGLASAAALTLIAGAAGAGTGNPCIDDARQQFVECRSQCREDFQVAKDGCLNRDHDCMEVCRAKRDDCRQESGIDAAIARCNAQLYDAKQNCRANNPPDSSALDHCIDQAQVVAFQCRDDAREAAAPALRECRAEFRACARACPPPPGGTPPVDPVQCRLDAKAALGQCRADCREQLQVQKDFCRNRDHACVEDCRAKRDGCRKPIEDRLNADIAACNTQLGGDKTQCENAYPNDPAGLDQCIDDAQVRAFICRDDARERARSGFADCRQQFQSCAEACPPAS